jgi:hypothetical protein
MAETPTPTEPIVRDVVLDVDLRGVLATDRVQIRRIQILPGHPAGLHIHNGPAGPDGATFLAYFLLRAGQEPALEFPGR